MIVEQREELREACAKVIMGWRALEIPWAYSGTVRCWHNADDVVLMTCHAWRPDEDDTQCMQVVERMVERGYLCSIQVEPGKTTVVFSAGGSKSQKAEHTDRRIGVLQAALSALQPRAPI